MDPFYHDDCMRGHSAGICGRIPVKMRLSPVVYETRKTQAYSCKVDGILCICQCLILGDRVTVFGSASHFRRAGWMESSGTAYLFREAFQLCPHYKSGISSRPDDGICDDPWPGRNGLVSVGGV